MPRIKLQISYNDLLQTYYDLLRLITDTFLRPFSGHQALKVKMKQKTLDQKEIRPGNK